MLGLMNAEFQLRTILVPTDGSDAALDALRYALAVAEKHGAAVVALRVVQLNIGGEELGVPRTRLLNEMAETARRQVRASVGLIESGTTPVRVVIAEGRPHVEILNQARQRGAELIVMAAHHYAGVMRWLHPHTCDRVLRDAPCPVLVIRERARGGMWHEL